MRIRTTLSLALAASLLVVSAAAAGEQTQTQGATTKKKPSYVHSSEPRRAAGEKTYKERINTVARKKHRHDINWLDSTDRSSWGEHKTWRGIRDERPLIARKTLGFHDPRPHRTRRERVLLISRGPIQGPGFSE